MPPKNQWGKRPRDQNERQHFTRFNELPPEQKLERRRQERQEKKERDRTMAYFLSVQRALEESSDINMMVQIVDGFFVELIKLLKADHTFHLLRNGTVCKIIEKALGSAPLVHGKTLLYVFLGHMYDIATSPVASYLLETLLMCITQGLCGLSESEENYEAEMLQGGPGVHVGSGLPSVATIVQSMTEELAERADALIVHEVGARALRSLILVLGGYTIRDAPPLTYPVRFTAALSHLTEAIVRALEEGYQQEQQLKTASEAWLAAAREPTTSFILQSLLRVCEDGTPTDELVRQRIDTLEHKGRSLLSHLLMDPIAYHVFEAYVKAPPTAAVLVAGDALATPLSEKEQMLRAMGVDGGSGRSDAATNAKKAEDCCWYRALQCVKERLEHLLSPGSELLTQTAFVLHVLAEYALTKWHLQQFYEVVVCPHLPHFMEYNVLTPTLVAFVFKCGLGGSISTTEDESGGGLVPSDVRAAVKKDEAQGVRFFSVPLEFQKQVCDSLCTAMRGQCKKGAAHFLLVDGGFGEKGSDLARYLLLLHPTASVCFQHTFERLMHADLMHLVRTLKGSIVLQQFVRAGFYLSFTTTAAATHSSTAAATATNKGAGAPEAEKTIAARLLARFGTEVPELAKDRYAAYVLEVIYEVSGMTVKEALVKKLVPLCEELKKPQQWTPEPVADETAVAGSEEAPQKAARPLVVARKVLEKCCVQQYMYRKDEWLKLAQRQCQVQKLLGRMLLD